MTGTLRRLASITNLCAQPRTCTTLPGAEPSSGSTSVWMLSMITSSGWSSSSAASTWGRTVSANNHNSGRTAPRRSARSRTCCALSSADTYKVRPGQAASACSSSVLLPTPGSPPRSVTEPGTSPPPSTRSSSGIPVERGDPWETSTSPMRWAGLAASSATPAASDEMSLAGSSTSSTKVFQAPHDVQRPAHFGNDAPQSEQL